MGTFSTRLARMRREAGFPTAYRFYHSNGGRRHFNFTYVHYLRLEKGTSLPRTEWLPVLLSGLRLSPGDPGTREFFIDFLKDLTGGDEGYSLIVAPLLCNHGSKAPAGPEAMRWMKAHHSIHLTPAQFKALANDETAYWCSEILLNDDASWTPAAAAEILGISDAEATRGLGVLERTGLARRAGRGRWRARSPGKFYTFPGRLTGMGGHLDKVRAFWERKYRRGGKVAFSRVELVRAESASMRRYAAGLAEGLDAANAYATRTKGDETGLYLVEARLRRLLPF
jgi:hypothetical protein